MLRYVVNRVLMMIPTMIAISIIVFVIIQLPPGNYLESYIAELQAQGESVDPQKIAFLREYYGLDKPLVEQYLRQRAARTQQRIVVVMQIQAQQAGAHERAIRREGGAHRRERVIEQRRERLRGGRPIADDIGQAFQRVA